MAGLDLSKQIGPLPLGGWGVVIAGGLFVGYMINRNMAKAPEGEPDSTQLTESGVGGGGGQFIYDPPTSGTTPDVPETNQTWGRKVLNWLIAQNHDPAVADAAVRKYLTGLSLNAAEKAMMSLVLIQFGPPPESIPVVEEPEKPPPATAPKPVLGVTGLRALPQTRAVNFTWNYDRARSPIGGFRVTVKDLKRGRIVRSLYLPASARSYRYTAPGSWNSRTKSKVQIWIVPFAGGWEVLNKRYGPGSGASATPII